MKFQSKNGKYFNSHKNKRVGGESKLVVKKGYKFLACSQAGLSKPGSHGPPQQREAGMPRDTSRYAHQPGFSDFPTALSWDYF